MLKMAHPLGSCLKFVQLEGRILSRRGRGSRDEGNSK